jgi:hypothetical protein
MSELTLPLHMVASFKDYPYLSVSLAIFLRATVATTREFRTSRFRTAFTILLFGPVNELKLFFVSQNIYDFLGLLNNMAVSPLAFLFQRV